LLVSTPFDGKLSVGVLLVKMHCAVIVIETERFCVMLVVACAGAPTNANPVRTPSPVVILMSRPLVFLMAGMFSPPFDGGSICRRFELNR
jgi:hypothetical protein